VKLDEVIHNTPDLEKVTIKEAKKLKRGDPARIKKEHVVIKKGITKDTKGYYYVQYITKGGSSCRAYIESKRTPMGKRDKNIMERNIKKNLENFKDEPERIIKMAIAYYHNFTELNNYISEDVNYLMGLFPNEVLEFLKENGVLVG